MELDPGETLNKKIRNAQLEQVNFILGMIDFILVHVFSFQYSVPLQVLVDDV